MADRDYAPRQAKHMPDDEIVHHLKGILGRGVNGKDRSFILGFFRAHNRGWKITDKMRFKAECMVDEARMPSEPLVEEE